MRIIEIGTGYTSIPAQMGAATEIVVEELTKAMLKQGHNVTILDIKDRKRAKTDLPINEVYMPQLFSTGAVVKLGIVHKIKRVLYSISLAYKLCNIIKKSNEHLFLHFHNQYNLYFFLKLTSEKQRRNVTIGYTVHSYIWFGDWESIKDVVNRRYFQEIYCCQHADRVFVLNDIVANMLETHYGVKKKNICKVINGVNIDVYNEQSASKDDLIDLRDKYGFSSKKVIFQVGSICDRKNQLGTLELLLPLMKRDEDIVFAYAGGVIDQEYALRIQEKAIEEGVSERVIYYGEVAPGKQLAQLYALSSVCIVNSKSESFALVIAEALSVPRPVFISESIINNLFFWKDNIGNGIILIDNEFEQTLQKVLYDTKYRNELQNKGRTFIETEYSWKKASIIYTDAFVNQK